MENLNIEKFDPTVEELRKIATAASAVVVTDFTDKTQLDLVIETRKQLKAARVRITKTGKGLREEALKFQRDVIAKEKELVAIIEPEEERLSKIEEEVERQKHIATMKLLLPVRRARIAHIGYTGEITDDQLNAMNVSEFETRFLRLQQHMNELNAKKLADERAAVEVESKRQADEKTTREREDKARADERAKIEREQSEAEERRRVAAKAEAERIESEARVKAENIEREARQKAEAEDKRRKEEQAKKDAEEAAKARAIIEEAERKAAIEKATRFNKFLSDHGVTEKTANEHEQRHVGNTVQLWRKVATYIVE